MPSDNQIKIGKLATSRTEIKDLVKAWIAVSIAFAIIFNGSSITNSLYGKFILASLTVGLGFLLHELGHKFVAQRYGCLAEFRSFDRMLLLAIAMSFFGFVFAAPGAVMISGRVNKERNGKISAAGPVVNLILALLFLLLVLSPLSNLSGPLPRYGFMINSWLALFNMIPVWLFDGQKVLKWNKFAYGTIVAIALSFMILQHFLFAQ